MSTSICSPFTAEIGTISSKSISWSTFIRCSASTSRPTRSILVTIATTRGPRRPVRISTKSSAMNRSPGPIFWSAGRQNPTTSTSPRVSRTRSFSRSPRSVRGRCTPGVSTRMIWESSRVTMPRIARRVVCGLVEVIATFSPTSALVRVDLPTLGRPTRATNPARCTPPLSAPVPSAVPGTCCSSLMGILLVSVLVLVVGRPAHQHRGEPFASAGRALRLEVEAEGGGGAAGDRHPPGGLGEQPANGVDVIVVDVEVEQLPHLGEARAGGHPVAAAAEVLDLGLAPIVLVGDLADDLLEDVLDGDDAGHS